MCTVSFISHPNKHIITSNRDEHISRPVAFAPGFEIVNGCQLLFPKDPQAGGTWFAINQFGHVAVLLNGAFEKHVRTPPYSRSRGLVLLEILSHENPLDKFESRDLNTIEPFTLILLLGVVLMELRWDGIKKHIKILDVNSNYIWSSATLYSMEVRLKKENLFEDFLQSDVFKIEENIIRFHFGDESDNKEEFIINRENVLKTVSITQAVVKKDLISMQHLDLLNDRISMEVIVPNLVNQNTND